ncbi:MAG: cupredoxin domain-containing protein [Candidatus Dojkabacteria bacterium]|nr:cupredoxin domain-containing protein [Candidatus Dojkabacteria bacterium]MDQ7021208.1 cupredoxin domain-containing protein [Candidatus Dojkabacteria bacterium]
MNKNPLIYILALAIIVIGGYLGYQAFNDEEEKEDSDTAQVDERNDEVTTTVTPGETNLPSPLEGEFDGTIFDFAVTMSNNEFDIPMIAAEPGDTINVLVISEQGSHSFVIDELNVDTGILTAGERKELSITIPEDMAPGTYEFYCGVGNHRAQGMIGEFVVTQL